MHSCFTRSFFFATVMGVLLFCAAERPVAAQQTAVPQPLTAMPYSPSLDISDLDRTVDPCVDFYKFSCGGWQKNNPIPADQSAWSVYGKLADENLQFLWGVLKEDATLTNRTPVQQKVGDYFNACMDTPQSTNVAAPRSPAC